jgi:CDP-diglyceride synthetase
VTLLCVLLVGWSWLLGLAIACAAMAGDLFSSFLKRRLGLPPSAQVPLLDEIPESFFPALVAKAWLGLDWTDVGLIVTGFLVGHLVAERLADRARHRG